ncbi:MAG: 50S ribosomal protein L29 [Acidimicrobiia bacterium]|nr:MAG: 50S ribosomal protein L29 [Acidimicrobiia bacterium]
MNATELRAMTYKELGEMLEEAKEELFNLRFQMVSNQLDNTQRFGEVKRDIARVKTLMREQEIEAWEAQQEEA